MILTSFGLMESFEKKLIEMEIVTILFIIVRTTHVPWSKIRESQFGQAFAQIMSLAHISFREGTVSGDSYLDMLKTL